MAFKEFKLDEQVTIKIYKRKASRSLRLSVAADGQIKVSIPTWTPYQAGLSFARSRYDWIKLHQRPSHLLVNGQQIGKAHHLQLLPIVGAQKVTSRTAPSEIIVKYPSQLGAYEPAVQNAASKASVRALRAQAEQLLPQRLAALARNHDFSYSSVSVKLLKSRWGSCDQHGAITLNLYLMQLPWDCIDYVLLHELTHTRVLHHGPAFWQVMRSLVPNLPALRKAMRSHQPVLLTPGT